MTVGGPPDTGIDPQPRVRGPRPSLGPGGRSNLIAAVSTVVVFLVLALVVTNAPGWPAFQALFLNAQIFWYSLPLVAGKFWVNVRLFLTAEVLILVWGLVLAVMRSLPGPVFFPVRLLATIYVDVFRALPGLLVIYMLGFGIPALGIPGVPNDTFFWGLVALTLLYSAYVSEVYRAGIDSVHPSQRAAALAVGLTQTQTMRRVVLPQAVRRVLAPLLNDFISLQKDTALVSIIGAVEIMRAAGIDAGFNFNYTPYVMAALFFIVLTVPLARFTDWIAARQRGRQQGLGAEL